MMQTLEQKNTETAVAFIEELGKRGDLERTEQFFAGQMMEAFTNRHWTVEETLAQGEKVTARVIITGTHSGMFAGHAPTGKQVRIAQFHELRVVDGSVVHHRPWFDTGTLLPQLKAE